jgi:hypothetical protein
MITAPSNSHLFFVIEGLPLSIPSAIPVPSVNSTDKPCIEDVYEGNCPVLLQTMRLLCSMTPLRVKWLSDVRPPNVRFEL